VRRDRRAMADERFARAREPREPREHRALGPAWRRRQLQCHEPAARERDEVGERAPGVDADGRGRDHAEPYGAGPYGAASHASAWPRLRHRSIRNTTAITPTEATRIHVGTWK